MMAALSAGGVRSMEAGYPRGEEGCATPTARKPSDSAVACSGTIRQHADRQKR
jgi:hypothetical protein